MARDNQQTGSENASGGLKPDGAQELSAASDVGVTGDEDFGGGITLESILAEYKGEAIIRGEKKPARKPEEPALRAPEERGGRLDLRGPRLPADAGAPDAGGLEQPPPESGAGAGAAASAVKGAQGASRGLVDPAEMQRVSEKVRESIAAEVQRAIEQQARAEEETRRSVRRVFGLFGGRDYSGDGDAGEDFSEELEPLDSELAVEEEVLDEPDYHQAARQFAVKCNDFSLRSFVSLLLAVVMAVLTALFDAGGETVLGLELGGRVRAGILLIMMFLVMMLSVDRLARGFKDIFRGRFGIDSLNLLSCLAVAAAGLYTVATGDSSAGMPYCAVAASALAFTLWGEKIYYRALTETMKTAGASSSPCGVVTEMFDNLGCAVIRKAPGKTDGFYNNLMQEDILETAYRYITPMLVVSAAVLAVYVSLARGNGQYLLHCFAAIMAAAAPFSSTFAYAVPFSAVARRARQSGAAVAGWGGADEMYHSDGASITDDDVFPPGTVSISGVKILDEVPPEKAIRYTASLVVASNSGLARVFKELLLRQGMNLIRVEDFSYYEGGLGGLIRGERVYTGSAAFMNLMGVRVPASLNMKNAVFTAVNKRLIAVFAMDYVPTKAVQSSLLAILRRRVKLFFAVRDFAVTPVMLEQKFKIPVDNVEYIPVQNTYEITSGVKQDLKRVSAILTREGIGAYAEAIVCALRLRSTSIAATAVAVVSAVAGMLIVAMICWTGAFSAASAVNVLIYMVSMLVVVLLVCGFAKFGR